MDVDGSKRVFQRLGFSNSNSNSPNSNPNPNNKQNQRVCYHWRAGKCTRNPCNFLHRELHPPPPQLHQQQSNYVENGSSKRGFAADQHSNMPPARRNPNFSNTWGRVQSGGAGAVRKTEKVCNFWMQDKCRHGDQCRFLHSWCTPAFSLVSHLQGHQKVVTGIALPSGSDKLYTGSKDETLRLWDCRSGQPAGVINLPGEVGSILSEGPWLFVGLPNVVKAWNAQTASDLTLSGPVGQVYALVVGSDLLFAGVQDGDILAWKFNPVTNSFEPAASLKGHTRAVVTFVVGANRLYSGSMDYSIKVWSLENLQCLQTLTEHTSVVMSVLCWDQFLLSCSLDKTIKVWVASDSGNLEVTYTHNEDHGVVTLCGMHDAEDKPVLLCACNDNTIRVYDLPSFSERGKIYTKEEVRSIQVGPGGLFFTGDGTGEVRVWNWLAEPTAATA